MTRTISVSDEAYQRLLSWKQGKRDTFSRVIERQISRKGSIEALLDAAADLPEITEEEAEALEVKIKESETRLSDPWKR